MTRIGRSLDSNSVASVVWILDAGAEGFLPVSLGSLRVRAPEFWRDNPKIVVDCGISEAMKGYLGLLTEERVHVVPGRFRTSASDTLGVPAMRQRVEISEFAQDLRALVSPLDGGVLVVDTDTVFLRSPIGFPFPDGRADVAIMPDWDIVNGKIVPTPMFRSVSLQQPQSERDVEHIARQLGLSAANLLALRSHNTGVFGFRVGRPFSAAWRTAYEELSAATDLHGRAAFAPFAAEQNAMSLAIYRGGIVARPLSRRYNRLPPRPPRRWPAPTVIAHFVTFRRFHHEQRYALWFQIVEELREAGVLPADFVAPYVASGTSAAGGSDRAAC
jgi:hypothetical protein